MKLKVKQDNYGRVRKVRELSLNEKKKTQLRLSAHGHLQLWGTLQVLWIGLLMTMNGALHPWADVVRLYVTRREREREGGREGEREERERKRPDVSGVVRVEEHWLPHYLKRAEVNSDKVLDVFFVKERGKHELITEQRIMKLNCAKSVPTHTYCHMT